MVLSYFDFETLTCSGCGGYLPETTDPKNEGEYVAHDPTRCHRCTAIAAKQKKYEDAAHPSALNVWGADLRRRNG